MPKIAIDARELNGTGTGTYLKHLLSYLQQTKDDYEYVILLKPQDFESWHVTNPRFAKLASPYKEFTFAEQLGFWRQLRALKANLVYFPMPQQPILYSGKVVSSILDLTTIRFRNPTKNSIVYWLKQLVYKCVVRVVAHKSKMIITISQYVKDDLTQYAHIPESKVAVIYPAADKIKDVAKPIASLATKKFIMYVGRPLPHKNLRRLVDAFASLKESYPDLCLALAGKKDALYEQHEKYVKKKGIEGVYFVGFVSEGQLRWLYENTEAYIFPSLSEGFGLPGLEAMVHGAPVVSSNATCLPEIYGEAAHYFDPLDVDDMAEKISDVLSDAKLRAKLIESGKKQAAKYSWQKMAEQTLAVYNSILKQ